MCPPTRLRILDYLRKHQTASANELGSILAMTGANVRHHLAELESNDLIELISRQKGKRGRPINVYGLSRKMMGDGLDGLVGAMFECFLREAPEYMQEACLRSIAMRLGGNNVPGAGISFPRRLTLVVDQLNELHYQARWEAGIDGARIFLGHCPYAAIIRENPELCRMDAYLLEQRSGSKVEQFVRLQNSAKGYPYCIFRVVKNR